MKTTVTTFGHKNYGVRSERYRYIVYEDGTEELYDHYERQVGMDEPRG